MVPEHIDDNRSGDVRPPRRASPVDASLTATTSSAMPAATLAGAGAARIVSSAMAASVTTSLVVFLVGAQAVQIRQSLHFDATTFGLAVSVYYLGAGVGSVPAGRLADSMGAVRVMRATCLAAAVMLALVAVTARSLAILVALLFVGGLASAAAQPAINLFLSRRTPLERQGISFGIKQASIPLSALVGGLAVPAVALTVGWQWAFAGAAVLAGLAAVVVPRPETTLAEHRSHQVPSLPRTALPPLVVLAIGFGLGVFAENALTAFTATSAVTAGIARPTAGLLVALGGGTAVTTRVVSGVLADRRGHSHLPMVAAMLLAGSLGYGLLSLAAAGHSLPAFTVGVLIAYGAGWGWNGLFNFAVVRTHPDAAGRVTGITQVGGRLAGAAGPLVFSVVAEHLSYPVAWAISGGTAVVGAGVILTGRQLLRRRLTAEPVNAAPTVPRTR